MDWRIVTGGLTLAIGAAMAFGTGLALLRYYRTGVFPGQPEGADVSVTSAWVKVAIGAAFIIWGLATLSAIGFL